MNITQTKRFIHSLPINQAILLDGNHGLGKSEVVAQCAREMEEKLGEPVGFVDFRLSQNDVGDLRGLPFLVGGQTYYAPPTWYPIRPDDHATLSDAMERAGEALAPFNTCAHGILFLDEFNRASREVLQCAFELVLDRRLNGLSIPDGWRVVAAVNGNADIYIVNEWEPALLSRFYKVEFKPSFDEWAAFAKKKVEAGEVHDSVYKYLMKRPEHLDADGKMIKQATTKGKKVQDRRAWLKLGAAITAFGDKILENAEELYHLSYGWVGMEMASSFGEFVKNDYRVLTAGDILDKFSKTVQAHIAKSEAMELTNFNKILLEEIDKRRKLTKTNSSNLLKFIKAIPNEVASDFWMTFSDSSRNKATSDLGQDWFGFNPEISERLMECMSKPKSSK